MQKKNVKVLLCFVAICVMLGGYIAWKISTVPQAAVHYHANFLVLKDGVIQDYSDDTYMEFEPCALDEKHGFFEKEKRVHLHNNVGSVVHVHSPSIRWDELFSIIGIDGASATYVVNGKKVENLDEAVIQPQDRALIILGTVPKDVDVLFEHVPSDAIEYAQGKKSAESCSTSGGESYSLWQRFRIAFGL